mgnify:CR=1 FL=1
MALVNTVEKRIKMQKDGVIKYQIITFCFLNDLQLSKSDLECLLELAKKGSINVTNFCKHISSLNIFKSAQSWIRNDLDWGHPERKNETADLFCRDGGCVDN